MKEAFDFVILVGWLLTHATVGILYAGMSIEEGLEMLQTFFGVGADGVGDVSGRGVGDATKDMRRDNEALVIRRHVGG